MLIRDVLQSPIVGLPRIDEDLDPLRSPVLLHESQVLDVLIDALRSTAAVLLELRAAFDCLTGNTAVIVMRGVRNLSWTVDERRTGLTAWTVVGASVGTMREGFDLGLGLSPDAELIAVAGIIEYYALDADIGETIPDYTDADDDLIRSTVSNWESVAVPREFSMLAHPHP